MSGKRIAEGLTVITVGCLLLANTLGYLSWGVWWTIASLWPVLIVALGLEILGKSLDNEALRVFSSLVVVGGLLVGALVLPTSGPRWYSAVWFEGVSEPFSFSEPHDARVREGFVEVSAGAGDISIAAGEELATADGESPFDDPSLQVDVDGMRAAVDISTGSGAGAGRTVLDVTLDDTVAWDVEFDSGAVSLEADLSNLIVESLDLRAGASDLDITFGSLASRAEASIRVGVSSIVIRVPKSLGVEVRTRSGLSSVDAPSDYGRERSGDSTIWQSPGFDRARRTLVIDIEAGISDIQVVTY